MKALATDRPYRIDGPATINFSGGRSSGFMLYRILDACNGKLPDDVIVVFTNTGKERPETLDFVQRCSTEWNVRVRWLEYRYRAEAGGGIRDPKNSFEEVDHNSASRDGRPFEELVVGHNYLPNPVRRTCTQEMKVNTIRRFLFDEYGWRDKDVQNVLGIRYDEKRRWGRMLYEGCRVVLPMVLEEHTKSHVMRFWRESDFDLGIPSERGNCDLCFLKGRKNLIDTIREKPELVDWWIQMENTIREKKITEKGILNATFRRRDDMGYAEMAERAKSSNAQPSLLDNLSEDDWIECHCTD